MFWPVLARLFGESLDWLQVEVTSHCNAACAYCPRTVYRQVWQSRHLSLDLFRRLLPDLPRIRLLHLQGWGEPFLNPDFLTMLSLAKAAGCRVGTTTNGMLLDADMMASIIDGGLDMIAFSLAGTGEDNDRIRRGTRFAQVMEAVKSIDELKARKGVDLPQVHIAYMLLRSGLAELRRLPQVLKGLGVSQVVVSTLDFVAAPELIPESLRFMAPEERLEVAAMLTDLAEQGRGLGLPFHFNFPPSGRPVAACPENAGRAACVAADGAVTPCVFLNLPVQNAACCSLAGAVPYQRMTCGFLADDSLLKIWRSSACRGFRRSLSQGPLPLPCRHCLKLATPPSQP
ncbi:MAG: radical SAM/SPASM domain-containing protein [Deltaproteobacteria bacterium]|nr:radical SAM/SPASM domain-containing protein [Deltaproteobacteria bacterium]